MKNYTIDEMLPILSNIYKSSCSYNEKNSNGEIITKKVKAREFTIPLLYSNPGIGY